MFSIFYGFAQRLSLLTLFTVVAGCGQTTTTPGKAKTHDASTNTVKEGKTTLLRLANQRIRSCQNYSKRQLPNILKHQQTASQLRVFRPAGQTKDAGKFLNVRIPWLAQGKVKQTIKKFAREHKLIPTDLALPSTIRKSLENIRKHPGDDLAIPDVSGLRFSWLRDLRTFDHWEIEKNSPIEHHRPFSWTNSPIPNFSVLLEWAMLRLIKGHKNKRLPDAIAETTHLAYLTATTETQFGVLIAQMIQQHIDRARNQPTKPELRQFFKSLPAMVHFLNAPDLRKRILTDRSAPGLCAAIREISWTAHSLRQIAGPGLTANLVAHQKLLDDTGFPCRWGLLRTAWSETSSIAFVHPFQSLTSGPSRALAAQSFAEAWRDNLPAWAWDEDFDKLFETASTADRAVFLAAVSLPNYACPSQ